MLEMSIVAGDDPEDDFQFGVSVSATSSGVLCNYEGQFYPGSANSPTDAMRIEGYPRWSEEAGALCTRFLSMALEQDPTVRTQLPLDEFGIRIEIVPHGRYNRTRLLEEYAVRKNDGIWRVDAKGSTFEVGCVESEVGVCAAALEVLKAVYWGSDSIPSPVPFSVPVYEEATYGYVIMSEIPEPAQTAFRKSMAHSGRPPYPRDAAYSYDWTDFLAGSR
jgi:hypothetical protein